jgi:hypothetical protein
MDRTEKGMAGCFGVWFVFCAALGLGLLAVGVWAVITLVNYLVGH